MISQLSSPSVCVIDDEEDDFLPILACLNSLYVSCVHLLGTIEGLPPNPFNRLRLVFLDLHLAGHLGKNAASHTANVFTKVVSTQTAPIVVVIWSKYAADKVDAPGVPPDDQETEAQLFKRTLMEAEPSYNGRIIFVEMAKPKKDDRPADWHQTLKDEIDKALLGQDAVELLWAWDNLVKDGCVQVSQELTAVAQTAVAAGTAPSLERGLKSTMQRLARAQGGGDFSSNTAPRHLLALATELLVDQLEHPDGLATVAGHGKWLSAAPPGAVPNGFSENVNALLLTASAGAESGILMPGTVYSFKDLRKFFRGFVAAFGKNPSALINTCCSEKPGTNKSKEWRKAARPVLIELSPACDVAQGNRVNSLLIGGVIIPKVHKNQIKKGESWGSLGPFKLRWSMGKFAEQEVILAYCYRYRLTTPARSVPSWIEPWFRLRELPLAAIRNTNSAHAARVGYVSLS